jgi:hypothetical protein
MSPSFSTQQKEAIADSFMAKVIWNGDEDECWTWAASLISAGYGHIWIEGAMHYAHRVAYELFNRPIPDGLVIDHLCRNRRCVNPAHLEPVTVRENTLRGLVPLTSGASNRAKTHCPHGHPYSGDNLYIKPSNGARVCRRCKKEQSRPKSRRVRRTSRRVAEK